jgi:hypothetical protein|tara:strand:+ start:205 stop:543 length:339 start_codon:yes stop_codon:yes gene_type:complete
MPEHSIYDARGQAIRTFYRDPGEKTGVFHFHTPDISPLIEANDVAQKMGKGYTRDKSMRWVGRLHPITIMQKLKEYKIPVHTFMQMPMEQKQPIYYRMLRDEPVWRTSSGEL